MSGSATKLKAPFPYFGGKSKIADLVWRRLGVLDNYCEPFFGSGAVLIARPAVVGVETVNDIDCFVANFWRSTSIDPDAVAAFADGPVNEADLHARHRWLVLGDDAESFRQRMRTDPDYFDAKVAGWWCWGLCCWIGSGWCDVSRIGRDNGATPSLAGSDGRGQGVHRLSQKRPRGHRAAGSSNSPCNLPGVLAGDILPQQTPAAQGSMAGIHAGHLSEQLPRLKAGGGQGVNAGQLSQQTPRANGGRNGSLGVHGTPSEKRPILNTEWSGGKGVHSSDAPVCDLRREWITDWFYRLRDRLRAVRVCCGDWLRIVGSDSVTTRLGMTGVFLDPPYGGEAGRQMGIYSSDSADVAERVRNWCLIRGRGTLMRIALCGYAGEGHEELVTAGWDEVAWKAVGGYGNRTAKGRKNAGKERIWFSPACVAVSQADLFAALEAHT